MRYEVTTQLSPRKLLRYAKDYLDHRGCLEVTNEQVPCISCQGGGGHVAGDGSPGEKKTTLIGDAGVGLPVRQFMTKVS